MSRFEYGQVMSVLTKMMNQEKRCCEGFVKENPSHADERKRDRDVVCGVIVQMMYEMEKVCKPLLGEE